MKTLIGALAMMGGLVLQFAPLWQGAAVPRLAEICASSLGQFAQAASARVANDCTVIRAANLASWALLVGGGVLLALGLWKRRA